MATITNKTTRPLIVPLPAGKKLRLGPLKSADVRPKALEHAAVKKLVEAGKVSVVGKEQKTGHASASSIKSSPYSGGGHSTGGMRKQGDR